MLDQLARAQHEADARARGAAGVDDDGAAVVEVGLGDRGGAGDDGKGHDGGSVDSILNDGL